MGPGRSALACSPAAVLVVPLLLLHGGMLPRAAALLRTSRSPLSPVGSRCSRMLRAAATQADRSTPAAPPRPSFVGEAGAMDKYFDFATKEAELYTWWEALELFKPTGQGKAGSKKPYVIPMPPPNVTGYLHMGHALFVALQDILARFHRMRGEPTLWLPGTDHAGIATQLLVERALAAEGVSRSDLGREGFLSRVWEWKAEKGGYITSQMRRLGASADWSRERFTLEDGMSEAVIEAFVRLHEQGLIYKGDYMVNWSPNLQTAVSDLEVEYSEEVGKLYVFKYELADGSGHVPVATTRPETILGDTAVCVHPEDDRYSGLIGGKVKVPLTGREVPIIADEYVDREFGTGALKITPAHDPNDYSLGKKHSLPFINIMNRDGSINENGGAYEGMDRFDCRERLWADMDAAGLTIKVEPHTQRVPRSQRGGEVIEPLISSQWFLKADGMAKQALDAVESKQVRIIPERFEKTWEQWLSNIHDWCISRQLWWGHRIPVWYVNGGSEYVVARTEADAYVQAREAHGEDVSLTQDDDVLDTWFSSGLWPFSTVGWPANEGKDGTDLQNFYPATVLETGYDILFFWVARMVMMGMQLTGQPPFEVIYMHGLVRDAQGQKMSKTKGNVLDPLEIIEQYGADALRYSLVTGTTPGQDVPLSLEKVENNRNFGNKLWNAGRFITNALQGLDDEEKAALAVDGPMTEAELSTLPLPERYIVSRCHELAMSVTSALESYSFSEAGLQVYAFLWDEYADWYIENSKCRRTPESAAVARRVLVYVFDTCLRLLHPYMPFITETLWQVLPHRGESIMTAPWPVEEGGARLATDAVAVGRYGGLQELIRLVRNARAEYKVEAAKKIAMEVRVNDPALLAELQDEMQALALLARADAEQLTVVQGGGAAPADECVHVVAQEGLEAYLPLKGLVDADKERQRLTKQAERLRKDLEGLDKRLNAPNFTAKAKPEVVEETRRQRKEKMDQLQQVEKSLASL